MRSLMALAPILMTTLAACSPYSPSLGTEPFLCGASDSACPDGFTCITDATGDKVCAVADSSTIDAAMNVGSCSDDSSLEPNNTFLTAYQTPVSGQRLTIDLAGLAICPANDVDFYAFTIAEEGQIATAVVKYSSSGTPLQLTLYTADGTGSGTSILNATAVSGSADTIQAMSPGLPMGNCFAEVFSATGAENPDYELTLTVSGP